MAQVTEVSVGPVRLQLDATPESLAVHVKTLQNIGYRITSISAYGSLAEKRFAVVWSPRPTTQFQALKIGRKVAAIDTPPHSGYRPSLIALKGHDAASTFYACVYEPDVGQEFSLVDENKFDEAKSVLRAKNPLRYISCAGLIGAGKGGGQVGMISRPRTAYRGVGWDCTIHDSAFSFNSVRPTYEEGWNRPAYFDLADDGRLVAIWRDDSIGTYYEPVIADKAMIVKSAPLAGIFLGAYPIRISAVGAAENPAFIVMLAERDEPVNRKMTIAALPSTKNGAAQIRVITDPKQPKISPKPDGFLLNTQLANPELLDAWMMTEMQNLDVWGAQLAVTKGGRLVFSRSYTWADDAYPVVQPTSAMNLASVSKLIAYVALLRLIRAAPKKFNGGKTPADAKAFWKGNPLNVPFVSLLPRASHMNNAYGVDAYGPDIGWGLFGYGLQVPNLGIKSSVPDALKFAPPTHLQWPPFPLQQSNPAIFQVTLRDLVRHTVPWDKQAFGKHNSLFQDFVPQGGGISSLSPGDSEGTDALNFADYRATVSLYNEFIYPATGHFWEAWPTMDPKTWLAFVMSYAIVTPGTAPEYRNTDTNIVAAVMEYVVNGFPESHLGRDRLLITRKL